MTTILIPSLQIVSNVLIVAYSFDLEIDYFVIFARMASIREQRIDVKDQGCDGCVASRPRQGGTGSAPGGFCDGKPMT
jgi:hypothetical protein